MLISGIYVLRDQWNSHAEIEGEYSGGNLPAEVTVGSMKGVYRRGGHVFSYTWNVDEEACRNLVLRWSLKG